MNLNKLDRNQQKRLFFNVVLFVLILFMAIRLPLDTDFWWHIRAGQLTIENGYPVLKDFTSFTVEGNQWVNHSWLAQVIFFLIYSFSGNLGMMIFVAFLATLSMLLVYLRLRSNVLVNAFVMVLCVATTAVVWTTRPQLFSLLFFSILSFLVFEKDVVNSKKFIFAVAVLFLFWSNLHAGFSIGIILIATFIFGLLLDNFFYIDFTEMNKRKNLLRWIGLLLFVSIIVLIKPN